MGALAGQWGASNFEITPTFMLQGFWYSLIWFKINDMKALVYKLRCACSKAKSEKEFLSFLLENEKESEASVWDHTKTDVIYC